MLRDHTKNKNSRLYLTTLKEKGLWDYFKCVCPEKHIEISAKTSFRLNQNALIKCLSQIVHSDRGGQYRSTNFKNIINGHQCIQSMSGADNPYDNAYAESFFSRFKAEMLPKNGFKDLEDASKQTFEYIEMYYNTTRLHSGLKYFSPASFEECYYQNQSKTINLQTPNETVLNEGMDTILRFE